ncbi:MAG: Na+/H+ antiporter NhaC family protein [Bacillota bacterium]|nr:Na+/H+ antiporter NhaC family protein [Bacillota bacterium]
MDIIASFFICFILFVLGAVKGIFVGYTLTCALVLFIAIAVFKGFKIRSVLKMVYDGGKKVFIVLQIFVLIGAIISVWMASGTVQSIVYYGLKYINANYFILSAFIISSIVSLLIGTSFGTVSTVGIALMVMARGGNVNTAAAAGAIIAGAYFGDRCSPMSSSANLVSTITSTDLYVNIKNMIRTSIVPVIASLVIYGLISLRFPMTSSGSGIGSDIALHYKVGIVALLPALIILVLSLFRVNVKLAMLISIAAAALISVTVQQNTPVETLKYIMTGYSMKNNSNLAAIITGGGIISMLKVSFVVFISSGFTGIFEGTGMLSSLEKYTAAPRSDAGRFCTAIIVSIVTAAFGCTQVMAVILTYTLMKKSYQYKGDESEEAAVSLENTAIVIAPLIPWNIAVLVPLTSLNAGFSAISFSVYLYLLPLWNLLMKIWKSGRIKSAK